MNDNENKKLALKYALQFSDVPIVGKDYKRFALIAEKIHAFLEEKSDTLII